MTAYEIATEATARESPSTASPPAEYYVLGEDTRRIDRCERSRVRSDSSSYTSYHSSLGSTEYTSVSCYSTAHSVTGDAGGREPGEEAESGGTAVQGESHFCQEAVADGRTAARDGSLDASPSEP